jgi:hypothetical protein
LRWGGSSLRLVILRGNIAQLYEKSKGIL